MDGGKYPTRSREGYRMGKVIGRSLVPKPQGVGVLWGVGWWERRKEERSESLAVSP